MEILPIKKLRLVETLIKMSRKFESKKQYNCRIKSKKSKFFKMLSAHESRRENMGKYWGDNNAQGRKSKEGLM